MKACFPIVGEKEYKDSILRTKRRLFVFTKLRVETVFISFVSFSFNKLHVSVPTRTSIRVIGEIRVLKKYSCHSHYYLHSVCGPSANLVCKKIFVSFEKFVFKIRASKIRVRIKRQRKIRVKRYSFYSGYYFPSVSGPTANLVFKRPSNQNIIPVKATNKNSKQ